MTSLERFINNEAVKLANACQAQAQVNDNSRQQQITNQQLTALTNHLDAIATLRQQINAA